LGRKYILSKFFELFANINNLKNRSWRMRYKKNQSQNYQTITKRIDRIIQYKNSKINMQDQNNLPDDKNDSGIVDNSNNNEISELKNTLKELEKKWDTLVKFAPAIIMVISYDGTIHFINHPIKKYTPEQIIGTKIYNFVPPDQQHIMKRSVEKVFKKGVIDSYEILGEGPEGLNTAYYKTYLGPILDEVGNVTSAIMISTDITDLKRIEDKLKNIEERYNSLFNRSMDCLYIHDFKGNFLDANPAALKLFGYKKEELKNINFAKLLSKRQLFKAYSSVKRLKKLGFEDRKLLWKVKTKNGEEKHMETTGVVIYHNGNPSAVLGIGRDVTEQNITREALIASEERYKTIFENVSDEILLLDRYGKIVDVNSRSIEMTGRKPDEIIGKKFSELGAVKKRDLPRMLNYFKELIIKKKPLHVGKEIILRKDGSEIIVDINVRPIVKNNKTVGIVTLLRDITREARAEEKIKTSEEKWRSLVQNSPDVIMNLDSNGIINFINHIIPGYSTDDIIGKSIYNFLPEDQHEKTKSKIEYVFKTGESTNFESVVKDPDGNEKYLSTRMGPIKENNRVVSVVQISTDITGRKKAELELLERKQELSIISDYSLDVIFMVSKTGKMLYISPIAKKLFGYDPEEMIGTSFTRYVPKKEIPHYLKQLRIVTSGKNPAPFKSYIKNRDGEIIPVEILGSYVKKDGKTIGLGTIRDIRWRIEAEEKEKKYVENQLFLSESTLELSLISASGDILEFLGKKLLQLTDKTYITIAIYNPEFNKFIVKKIFGYGRYLKSVLRLLGKSPVGMELNYDDERWKEKFRKGRIEKITKDDFQNLILPQMPKDITYGIEKIINIDEIFVMPLITEEKIFGFVFLAAYKGHIIKNLDVIETFINQTTMAIKRRTAEEKIKKQNVQLKKLDELKSAFLNITSHELRTPMSAIKGYVQMLLKQGLGEISEEQKQGLEVVLRNTNRLDGLIQDILDVSRLESGTMKFIPEKTDIGEMIQEINQTMKSSASLKEIKINSEISKNIPDLTIDKNRITQVIVNLVNNAIKFSPNGSTINIKAKNNHEDILFEVQDFGRGIPKDKQDKIFESFYQVDYGMDRKFGGTGLGLAISRGIVLSHGGKIWVESTGKPGEGSMFRFTLPLEPVKDAEKKFKELDMFLFEESKINNKE
jgi:PAS domain S-box-containing protein